MGGRKEGKEKKKWDKKWDKNGNKPSVNKDSKRNWKEGKGMERTRNSDKSCTVQSSYDESNHVYLKCTNKPTKKQKGKLQVTNKKHREMLRED